MSKKTHKMVSLDAGVVTNISTRLIDSTKGYTSNLLNVSNTSPGILTKRPAIKKLYSVAPAAILGVWEYLRAKDDEAVILIAAGGSLYRWDADTTAWVVVFAPVASTCRFNFLTFADSVIIANEDDPLLLVLMFTDLLQYRFPVVGSAPVGDSLEHIELLYRFLKPVDAPQAKYLAEYRLRIAAAGDPDEPSFLYLSHTGDPTLWNPSTTGSNATRIMVSPDDGEGISGLLNSGDSGLLVGKPSSLYGLFGYSRDNFAVDRISTDVGVASHKSMLYVTPYSYWVSKRGIYRMESTTNPDRISLAIQDVFDARTNLARLEESRTVQVDDTLLFTLPTGATALYTLAYDIPRAKWLGEWSKPHILESSPAKSVTGTPIIFSSATDNKQLYQIAYGDLTELTAAITGTLETLWLDADAPEVTKDIGDLYLVFKTGASADYTVLVEFKADDAAWSTLATETVSTGTLAVNQRVIRVPVGKTVRFFKVRISNAVIGKEFSPMSLYYTYILKEVL